MTWIPCVYFKKKDNTLCHLTGKPRDNVSKQAFTPSWIIDIIKAHIFSQNHWREDKHGANLTSSLHCKTPRSAHSPGPCLPSPPFPVKSANDYSLLGITRLPRCPPQPQIRHIWGMRSFAVSHNASPSSLCLLTEPSLSQTLRLKTRFILYKVVSESSGEYGL